MEGGEGVEGGEGCGGRMMWRVERCVKGGEGYGGGEGM